MIARAVFTLGCATSGALAQERASAIPDVPVGSLITIESSAIRARRFTGVLAGSTDGEATAKVNGGGTITMPWSRILRISVSDGREQRVAAIRDALIGIGAIAVAYPAVHTPDTKDAALPLAIALPITGALSGWLAAPHKWTPIVWRPSADPVVASDAPRLHIAPETELVVRTGRRQVKARLLHIDAETIALRRSGDTVRFSWPQVSEVRARGRRNHFRGAAVGISAMALATAVQFAVAHPERDRRQNIFLTNVGIGGALGLVVGVPGWTTIPAPSGR